MLGNGSDCNEMTSQKFGTTLVLFLAVFGPGRSSGLSLPKIFGDGMVLQAKPSQAHIWGKATLESSVHVNLKCESGLALDYKSTPVSSFGTFGLS